MSIDDRIQKSDIADKLNDLGTNMPGASRLLVLYGAKIAQHLPEHFTPTQFVSYPHEALEALQDFRDVHSADDDVLQTLDNSRAVFVGTRDQIPSIAWAIGSIDFAVKVEVAYDRRYHRH